MARNWVGAGWGAGENGRSLNSSRFINRGDAARVFRRFVGTDSCVEGDRSEIGVEGSKKDERNIKKTVDSGGDYCLAVTIQVAS